jgi:hypothetical protein
MTDFYFSIPAGNRRALCISPLTRDELAAEDNRSGDGLGYYLYERDESADGLTILAEVGSEDTARQLYSLLTAGRTAA